MNINEEKFQNVRRFEKCLRIKIKIFRYGKKYVELKKKIIMNNGQKF